jgi:hypothetical protein
MTMMMAAIDRSQAGRRGASGVHARRRGCVAPLMGARCTISTRQLAAATVVVAAASLVRSPSAAAAAASTVLLDFEGIGNSNKVANYYGGGGGGTAKDYGVVFGPDAIGAVDSDAPGGSHLISNEPSPSTDALLEVSETDQLFVTVADGFTALYFQYAAFTGATVTLFDGPNLTGAVLGATNLPAVRDCSGGCEDPTGSIGVWDNVTACGQVGGPVSGTRLLTLAAPTWPPTMRPTNAPTAAARTCRRTKGMKGKSNTGRKQCVMKRMMNKMKAAYTGDSNL